MGGSSLSLIIMTVIAGAVLAKLWLAMTPMDCLCDEPPCLPYSLPCTYNSCEATVSQSSFHAGIGHVFSFALNATKVFSDGR